MVNHKSALRGITFDSDFRLDALIYNDASLTSKQRSSYSGPELKRFIIAQHIIWDSRLDPAVAATPELSPWRFHGASTARLRFHAPDSKNPPTH